MKLIEVVEVVRFATNRGNELVVAHAAPSIQSKR